VRPRSSRASARLTFPGAPGAGGGAGRGGWPVWHRQGRSRLASSPRTIVDYVVLYGACAPPGHHRVIPSLAIDRAGSVAWWSARPQDDGGRCLSTLGVVAGWPETRDDSPLVQLGGSPGAGLKPFDSLYGATRGVAAAEVSPPTPFRRHLDGGRDVIRPRGRADPRNVIAATRWSWPCLGLSADRSLSFSPLPLFHVTGLGMALAHRRGGTNVVVSRGSIPRTAVPHRPPIASRTSRTFPLVLAGLLMPPRTRQPAGELEARLRPGQPRPPSSGLHERTGAQSLPVRQSRRAAFVSFQRVLTVRPPRASRCPGPGQGGGTSTTATFP